MPQVSFVETVVKTWLALQQGLSPVLVASQVRRLPDGSKLVIELETQKHLALIEAWQHAECLDTTIHRIGVQQGTTLAAGPCVGAKELDARLLALRDALLADSNA